MTQVVFVRHGQTNGNVERRWQGWSDVPLNEVGRMQAELVARRLGELKGQVQAVYSSSLSRAYQTAQVIAEKVELPVRLITDLREFHFGEIEGMTTDEILARYPGMLEKWRNRNDVTFAYPGGESRLGFLQRIVDALELILARHPDETIIIVSHGGPLRAILSHYFPERIEVWQDFTAGNCSATFMQMNGAGARLIKLDDQEHLQEMETMLA